MTIGKSLPSNSRFPTRLGLTIPPWWQLWQVPVLLAGASAILAVWVIRPLWYDPEAGKIDHELARARRVLDDPHASASSLVIRLADVLKEVNKRPTLEGEVQYLLGSAYLRMALRFVGAVVSGSSGSRYTSGSGSDRQTGPPADQLR
jgi:hypothetical protein